MEPTVDTKRSSEQGFTLLEIVIAVTLVALMAVALWSVFRISLTSWSRGSEFIDAHQRHRTVLDLVNRQIASTYGPIAPVDLQTGGAVYPIFFGQSDSLQFVSLSSLRFMDNPGLTLVSYDVIHSEQGYTLVEREEQYRGLDPSRISIFDRNDEIVTPVFENLISFSFEYFDGGSNQRPSGWVPEWSGRETGRLPEAVSMTMIARDATGGQLNRHMVIPIMARHIDPRLRFVNPFDARPRRFSEDDPRSRR
jgi:prepilin-type N-terminal cleavage/methylation domain-containing protein